MKAGFFNVLLLVACAWTIKGDQKPASLFLESGASGLQLRLPQEIVAPVGGTRFDLKVEASGDLNTWSPVGQLESDESGYPKLTLDNSAGYRFFRLNPVLEATGAASDGAELFGYERVFREELRAVGFLTPEQFAAEHQPSAMYLAGVSFDPTTAKYWDHFNADPAVVNASLPADDSGKRLYDFRLNPAELGLFKTNGFVVSERLGSMTFADVFYRVFADDLPVFISADAILHAWHFSYQRLLEESEETQLAPALEQILGGMHEQLARLPESVRAGPLQESIADADYLLAVGRSLLLNEQVPTLLADAEAVTQTLEAITDLQFRASFNMFGTNRIFDFSQFTVRGHYERSDRLGRYFRAFMWTARADLRIFAAKPDGQTTRELGTAVVLNHLLQTSGQSERWREMDDLIRLFVGRTDAMTFAQLQPLLQAAQFDSLEAITSLDQLKNLQETILRGDLATQLIPGDGYFSPGRPDQYQLPPTYVLTGQRFNPDGWALGKVVFDRIHWNEEIAGYTFFGKVLRRYTSALDMAYAVLGNRQIGFEIAQRMLDTNSRKNLRDGLPYAHNLTALARTFDRIPPAAWEESIYTRWLDALRELATPSVINDVRFPEAMRTRAWAMRLLNTQLASYTELKHDTVLYAKQPYTGMVTCEYPAGFVEPLPVFWRKMRNMAVATATNLSRLPASGSMVVEVAGAPRFIDFTEQQAKRVAFCWNFAQKMVQLEALAQRELWQEAFSEEETAIIRGLMNRRDQPYFGPTFDGWYPGLFYMDYGQSKPVNGVWPNISPDDNGSNKHDPLVTDVHTAPPDLFDPVGGVLHEATGNVDLLLIAVDNGPDRMVFAGPVMSHYEFIVPGPTLKRLTDDEWKANFYRSPWYTPPAPAERPDWTRSYLVPIPTTR